MESLTANQLYLIANLVNSLSGPAIDAIVVLLRQNGYSVDDLLAQTAKNLEHTDAFLKMEAERVKAEMVAKPPVPKPLPVAPAKTKK